ncbi:hypothetical protein BN1843_28070 [Escherichia coli]|nr:hypothetical protein BN1843_28070 [Escherichia coli]
MAQFHSHFLTKSKQMREHFNSFVGSIFKILKIKLNEFFMKIIKFD